MSGDITPAERVFNTHLVQGPFLSGAARKRWRLISLEWPIALIAVSAATRPNGSDEYVLRFDLTNYPQFGPTARPWNSTLNAPLEDGMRPHGKIHVPKAFRTDWKNGIALYLPCDREAIQGHDTWQHQHPSMIWDPKGDITQYLRIVHDLLNSSDYTGLRCP